LEKLFVEGRTCVQANGRTDTPEFQSIGSPLGDDLKKTKMAT